MNTSRILVWDIPTRLFHWLLAGSFTVAYLTAEEEGLQSIHLTAGYTLLGLIAFRLVWGVIGSRYARFSEFLYSPAHIINYAKNLLSNPRHYIGHNPLGSVAVFLLLALGLATGVSGYLMYQSGNESLEEIHELFANGMLALVFAHIAGVLISSKLHRENLARGMVTGIKQGAATEAIPHKHLIVGAVLLAIVLGFWGYSWTHPFASKDMEAGEQASQLSGDNNDEEAHEANEHDDND